jgi:hypothetical protein
MPAAILLITVSVLWIVWRVAAFVGRLISHLVRRVF